MTKKQNKKSEIGQKNLDQTFFYTETAKWQKNFTVFFRSALFPRFQINADKNICFMGGYFEIKAHDVHMF